jgi:hypothetical protein
MGALNIAADVATVKDAEDNGAIFKQQKGHNVYPL